MSIACDRAAFSCKTANNDCLPKGLGRARVGFGYAVWLASFLLMPLGAAQAQVGGHARPLAPLAVDDLLVARWLREITLSPDGRLAAYTICGGRRPSDDGSIEMLASGMTRRVPNCSIEMRDTSTGAQVVAALGPGIQIDPSWSPNGRQLAFVSDSDGLARLWVYDLASRALRRVSPEIIRVGNARISNPQWSPDGRSILARILPPNTTLAAANEEINQHFRRDGGRFSAANSAASSAIVFSNPRQNGVADNGDEIQSSIRSELEQGDLGLFDVQTGAVRRLSRGARISWFSFSPDGSRVAYQDTLGFLRRDFQLVQELVVVTTDATVLHRIRHRPRWIWSAPSSWSPSGAYLSFDECELLTNSGQQIDLRRTSTQLSRCGRIWDAGQDTLLSLTEEQRDGMPRQLLWRVDPSNGQAARLAEIPGVRAQLVATGRADRVSRRDGSFAWVMVEDPDSMDTMFYRVDLTSGAARLVHRDNARIMNTTDYVLQDISDRSLVYARQGSQSSSDFWLLDTSTFRARRLTHANPQLDRYHFGRSRLIEWRGGHDGRRLRGSLILPSNYVEGRRYPLIVNVYGNASLSRTLNEFGGDGGLGIRNAQLLATRGYAVLFPDSYVREGSSMADIAAAVLPGVDRAVELGIADPERVGVIGHSYGGYSVLSLLVQTGRFRAAVASAGIYNLLTQYSSLEQSGNDEAAALRESGGQGPMGGSPWQVRERYIENSPFFYLDRITTPLLLFHGRLDPVPVQDAEAVFVGLRRLGQRVELVIYPDEAHGVVEPNNQDDYVSRYLAWFDQYLGSTR